MYALGDINGALVLNHVDRASIGKWTEAKINQEKTLKTTLSVPALGIDYFTTVAAQVGLSIPGLDATGTAQINAALLYYLAAQYKNLDILDYPGGTCSEEDYTLRANYYALSCSFLSKVSPAMAAIADFCAFKEPDALDPATFSATGYYLCDGEATEIVI